MEPANPLGVLQPVEKAPVIFLIVYAVKKGYKVLAVEGKLATNMTGASLHKLGQMAICIVDAVDTVIGTLLKSLTFCDGLDG
jgi:hypothetical protein